MTTQRWLVMVITLCAAACSGPPPAGPPGDGSHSIPDTLNQHPILLDASDKLLSWVTPQAQAYDQIVMLSWGFLRDRVPTAANGLKAYYGFPYLVPDTLQPVAYQHNVAGLFAMFTDSLLAVYQYTGDAQAPLLAQQILDYDLAHGLTPRPGTGARCPTRPRPPVLRSMRVTRATSPSPWAAAKRAC